MDFYVYLVFGLAVVVTLLTSLFKHVDWSAKTKNLLATVLSVLGAAVTVWLGEGRELANAGDVAQLAVTVYGGSQLLYNFLMRGTHIEEKIAEVEVL